MIPTFYTFFRVELSKIQGKSYGGPKVKVKIQFSSFQTFKSYGP